jgi:hypothetical protein
LKVTLEVNPTTGDAPSFIPNLKATVSDYSGPAADTINFKFFCNRKDDSNTDLVGYVLNPALAIKNQKVTTGVGTYAGRAYDNQPGPSQLSQDCNYTMSGTYTDKVVVERGSAPGIRAEAHVEIVVGGTGVPDPTFELTASPESINKGETVVLHWESTGAETVVVDEIPVTPRNRGDLPRKPDKTTTYVGYACNIEGTCVFDEVRVVVDGDVSISAPTFILLANGSSQSVGTVPANNPMVSLQWATFGAVPGAYVELSFLSGPPQPPITSINNHETEIRGKTSELYTGKACNGSLCSDLKKIAISVVGSPPPLALEFSLTADDENISSGEQTTLRWKTTNNQPGAFLDKISGFNTSPTAITGSEPISPNVDTEYSARACNPPGDDANCTAIERVKVTVGSGSGNTSQGTVPNYGEGSVGF